MKKKENYEGEVIRLKFPNKGIVKVAGEEEIVQVKNTLPGQKISFQLTKNKKNKKEGRILAVLEASDGDADTALSSFSHVRRLLVPDDAL